MMHAGTPARHTTTPDTPLGESPSAGNVFAPVDLLLLELAAVAFAVWVVIAEHARPGRPARLTRETLARRIGGAHPSTITRAVEQLEAAGWLKVTRIRAKRQSVNLYEPLRTITPDDSRRWVEIGEQHRAALELEGGAITPQRLRSLARWLYLGGREGWTRDTLAEYVERFGGSTDTAKRDRAALVRAGYLEVRPEPFGRTITAAPGRLPSARSTTSHSTPPPGGTRAIPRGARERFLGGHESDTEVTPVEVTPVEVTACGPARRARTGSNARAAATTAPPAPRAEERDEQNPAPVVELVDTDARDGRTEQEARNAAGVLLRRFPAGYHQQQPGWVRARLVACLAQVLAYGYGPRALPLGPEAILTTVNRHDRPERNPMQTLELALREAAADVYGGACPECKRGADDAPAVCDRCNPDRDTLTADELAALAADGWNIEATA